MPVLSKLQSLASGTLDTPWGRFEPGRCGGFRQKRNSELHSAQSFKP